MLPLFDSQTPRTLTEKVHDALGDGVTVVTANARAARFLRLAYAEKQRAHDIEMWASPAMMDWDSWLTSLWKELAFYDPQSPLLLTPSQERSLWNRVQKEDAQLVVSPEGLATLAQAGYALISDYRLKDALKTPWSEQDAEHFRQWALSFDRLCREGNWLSRSNLAHRLEQAARSGKLVFPRSVLLVGFDRLSPAQNSLIETLRGAGAFIEIADLQPQENAKRRLLVANDLRDELRACAQWCRVQLETSASKRIGVVAPDVGSIRAEAARIFREVLMPQSLDLASPAYDTPFEFSLGTPLGEAPAIRAALLLLRWLVDPLPEEEITWLLLSGFFNEHPSETLALARFDFERRNKGSLSPETPLDAFLRRSRRMPFTERVRRLLGVTDGTHSYAGWAEHVELWLKLAGWPGCRVPDSVQFQAQRRWQSLLDEMALLDFAGSRVAFRDFLRMLERQALETIFTPESRNAPVQILGALESSGQTFDAIWFLGADHSQWPPSGQPHPLLPARLQGQLQMPHSSAAVDTELARIVTARIAETSPECIFSYARQNKEGELRPSPLLPTIFSKIPAAIATDAFRVELQIHEHAKPEPALEQETTSSESVPWPRERSPGGASVLKSQADCPFQAFANWRLRAKPLNRTEWGLTAAERGSLLHHVLESIWSPDTQGPFRMVTLNDLRQIIASKRLDEVLRFHIGNTFASLVQKNADDTWMQAYLESEQHRLLTRLSEWMKCEAQRQPFEVIAREQKLEEVSIGDLKLRLRADRIDALPDGTRLILDYKTSDVTTKKWLGERPAEPQLPLYAAYGNVEQLSGLLFARIRAGKTGFVGHVADARQHLQEDLAGSNPLLNEPYNDNMCDRWQQALSQLAEEFLHGEASVDPKDGAKTCKYCPLPGLCRVAETNRVLDEGEDIDD